MQRRYIKKQVIKQLQEDKQVKEGLREDLGLNHTTLNTEGKIKDRYLFGYIDQLDVLASEVNEIFNLTKSDEAIIEDYEHLLTEQYNAYFEYNTTKQTDLPLVHLKTYLQGRQECINYHKTVLEGLKNDREFTQLRLFSLDQIESVYPKHN